MLAWKRRRRTKQLVAAQLRSAREEAGVTQTEVAKIIGCSPSALSVLESGRFASFELLDSYAWALGLDLSDLKYGNELAEQRRRR